MTLRHKLIWLLLLLQISCSYAGNLTIVNNTDKFSTCVINKTICSSGLSSGITKPFSTNIVDERIIRLACGLTPNNCRADVFLTNNCTGPLLTTVMFDVNQGVKSVTPPDLKGYDIFYSGFSFTLNQI